MSKGKKMEEKTVVTQEHEWEVWYKMELILFRVFNIIDMVFNITGIQ